MEKSRSQRILWLLEELKIDYELKVFKRTEKMVAPPELKEVHPLGKSPVIGVQAPEAEKPRIIAESGLIVEYLTEYFGKWLEPKKFAEGKEGQIGGESEEWLRYRFFMHYAEGSLMTLMIVAFLMHSKSSKSLQMNSPAEIGNRHRDRSCSVLHQAHHKGHRWQNEHCVPPTQFQDAFGFP